jgi:hypothetical protein
MKSPGMVSSWGAENMAKAIYSIDLKIKLLMRSETIDSNK